MENDIKKDKANNKKTNLDVSVETFDKELEKIGIIIQLVKVIFMIIAIGIFVFVIGKNLISAIKVVNVDEFNSKTYTNIIESIK